MNAYSAEDPIQAWKSKRSVEYYDVLNKAATTPRLYSYLFDGQFGSLDHAFIPVSSIGSMTIADATIWNINSNEPDIHDYNTDYGRNTSIFNANEPYRFSDHDPILFSVKFECGDTAMTKKNSRMDCDWVAKRPLKRCGNFGKKFCPFTCGLCGTR